MKSIYLSLYVLALISLSHFSLNLQSNASSSNSSKSNTSNTANTKLNVFYRKTQNNKHKSSKSSSLISTLKHRNKESNHTEPIDLSLISKTPKQSNSESKSEKSQRTGPGVMKLFNDKNSRHQSGKSELERLSSTESNTKVKKTQTKKAIIRDAPEPSKTPTPLIPADPLKIRNDFETLGIVMNDWMRISNTAFNDVNKFPSLVRPDYLKEKLKFDSAFFRTNEYFKKKTYNDPNYPPSRYHFWFRYTDKNLYYSTNPKDMNVLDSIPLRAITAVSQNDDDIYSDCLIIEADTVKWNVCNEDFNIKIKWFCQLKKDMGVDEEDCHSLVLQNIAPTVVETKVTEPIILIPLPSTECNEKWSYKEKGSDWECDCQEGKEQSPIDLPDSNSAILSPVKPVFFYEVAPCVLKDDSPDGEFKNGDKINIKYNNGYLRIKHPNFGQAVTLDGVIYKAQEVRFHTPSEHTIKGKSFGLEIEIIHHGQTPGAIQKHLVLSVLYNSYPGVYNKFLDDLDPFNLPNPLNNSKDLVNDLHINKLFYNTDEDGYMQMKDFDFFTYQGSMTAPPCTENTIRIVVSTPLKLSTTILYLLKEAIKVPDSIDSNGNVVVNNEVATNNRKTQALHGRKVYFYNSPNKTPDVPVKPKTEPKGQGHYEKVQKKYTSYYHVSTDKPSGLPGSFVVPESEATGKSA